MFLSRFGVKNYKCLGEIDVPLTPIHVLIGENDAGKTSLLEAMTAFFASPQAGLLEIFPEPWNGRELVFQGGSETSVDLWGEWADTTGEDTSTPDPEWRYGFAAEFSPQGKRCTTKTDWIEREGERSELRPRAESKLETGLRTINTGWLGCKVGVEAIGTISRLLRPIHTYAFDAKVMAIPAAINLDRKFRLDRDGFGLATLLGDILEYDAEQFLHLKKQFCDYFPQFKTVRVESEEALSREPQPDGGHQWGRGVGKAVYFETRDGARVRAQQASDGVILFLGFLAVAHLPEPPNLLLIEEPENGIYPKRLGQVITLLKELVGRTDGVRFPQIIMSTHSPYVLSFFEPEEVTFLSRPADDPAGPVRARPMRDAPNIRERMGDGFYLGELWYNLSEEDLFGDS